MPFCPTNLGYQATNEKPSVRLNSRKALSALIRSNQHLGTLHIQIVDGYGHLTVLIDCDMVQHLNEQITLRAAANELKALHRSDTGWEGRTQSHMIHSRSLICDPTRQTYSCHVLIIEMPYHTAIGLCLIDKVDGATDLDQLPGAIGRTNKINQHLIARSR